LGKFRGHVLRLYLDVDLYSALIKLQADRNLGRSFAGFLPLIEGLYQMGYINKKVYESHKRKYSKPLKAEETQVLTKDEIKEEQEKEKLNKNLGLVADQWDLHPSVDSRNKKRQIALENP